MRSPVPFLKLNAMSTCRSLTFDILTPVAIVLATFTITRCLSIRRRKYPPGPPGWPILGNMLDLPVNKHWLQYDSWTKQYGAVVESSAHDMH